MTATTDTTPRVIFTCGGPGAGKSYIIGRDYADMTVVDCDSWKLRHPDYDPKNPGTVHAWSSKMAAREFFSRLANGESFIYDSTAANVEKLVNWINQAHLAGYEVEVVYVRTSLQTAIDRNANRERSVPEDLLREKHALVGTAVEILSGYADRLTVVNNG